MTKNKGKKRSGSVVREVEYVPGISRRGSRKLVMRDLPPTPSASRTPLPSPSKSCRSTQGSESPTKRQRMLDEFDDFYGSPPPSVSGPSMTSTPALEIPQKKRSTKVSGGVILPVITAWQFDNSGQSQNDYLKEFIPKRNKYLHALLECDGWTGDGNCAHCRKSAASVRCMDCYGRSFLCRDCLISGHQYLPFHRVEAWNGRCFLPSSLFDQGFVLHVGHEGRVCTGHPTEEDSWEDEDQDGEEGKLPTFSDEPPIVVEDIDSQKPQKVKVILVVDKGGIFHHRVAWCNCHRDPDYSMMLFQNHLFPTSFICPETVFTFNVLDDFYMDSMECKTSANNYYSKLSRLTSNTFPHNVPVGFIIFSPGLSAHVI